MNFLECLVDKIEFHKKCISNKVRKSEAFQKKQIEYNGLKDEKNLKNNKIS